MAALLPVPLTHRFSAVPLARKSLIYGAWGGVGCQATFRIMGVSLQRDFPPFKNFRPRREAPRALQQPNSGVIVCAEMNRWGYVGAKIARAGWPGRLPEKTVIVTYGVFGEPPPLSDAGGVL